MRSSPVAALFGVVALFGAMIAPSSAQQLEKRIALVIGEGGYAASALATAPNDAGLVAQTLQAAGFDVVGARDLDTQGLREALREFVGKAQNSGPDTVAMLYFAGYGLQSGGENYLAGVDAHIATAADVAINAVRVSDFLQPLAALPLKARIVVLDAARKNPFAASGQPLAGGLALMQPDDGTLIALNAAPGTIGPEEPGPFGVYAKALVEMIKAGGAPVNDMFDRVRMRVSEATQGAQIPWSASRVALPFMFFDHTAEAPTDQRDMFGQLLSKPIASFGPRDAYLAAVARDTLEGYQEFLTAFPNDPLAARVRAILAARREATIWRETCAVGTAPAYWTYVKRYPRGPHVYDARRALVHLDTAVEPPPTFEEIDYDVPPPPPDEIIYVEQPVIYFDDPIWAFPPPPPPPIIYFVAAPFWFAALPPPLPPVAAFVLPIPTYYPVAAWVAPPPYVAPAPTNVFIANIHNTVVVNQAANTVTVTNAAGQILPTSPANIASPPAGGGLHPGVAAAAVALPAAAALRAMTPKAPALPAAGHALPSPGPTGAGGVASPLGGAGRVAPGARPSLQQRGIAPFRPSTMPPATAVHPARPAAPRPRGLYSGAPAPRPGPHFVAPHRAPRFQAPAVAPRFTAPHRAPTFAAPPRLPHYGAPQPAPHFAAPRPTPHFAAPRSAPHFVAPPHFAAPHAPAPRQTGHGNAKPHW
ncbi:caspase family protein [Rhodoblastus acidophilus]|uniref:Caspase family protein n=1 Tax=Candidatus Rhodoblastus alkanivorans TaxID=2954117 RepID=A0ABS9Z3T4_9HYPH|nr:caspase family protein [Candidatus Rhodoblastus alkanivorans]MCI4680516.1 caspase family protein [Candidatus Rhodoblastus alkanivorans]MCI4682242.1 caspase family protein [Candidatus Rhodoblastus alkanivorans]MDI4639544.1 caspase family protein [Rhodoblastus acidophilus]